MSACDWKETRKARLRPSFSRHFELGAATLSPFALRRGELGFRQDRRHPRARRPRRTHHRRRARDAPELTARFDGGDTFSVEGTDAARDLLNVGAGVGVALTRDVSLDIGYAGRFGDDLTDHGGNAALAWRF